MDTILPFQAFPARKRRPLLGSIMIVCGIGLLVAVLTAGYILGLRNTFGRSLVEMSMIDFFVANGPIALMLIIAFLGAPLLIKIGSAYRQSDAIELLKTDRRAPILYLRSFDDDDALDMTKSIVSQISRPTIEMRLARVFAGIGPVVSIGRPGERLPKRGSNRFYVADEDWQEAVLYFLERSAAVIVMVGSSSGVAWEIRTALAKVPREKLLFVFPFILPTARRTRSMKMAEIFRGAGGHKDALGKRMLQDLRKEQEARYRVFRQEFSDSSKSQLPERIEGSVFMDFFKGGTARVLHSKLPPFFRFRRDKQGITLNYRSTLRPFVEKVTGHEIKPGIIERFFTKEQSLMFFVLAMLALLFVIFRVASRYEMGYWGWGVVLVGMVLLWLCGTGLARIFGPVSFVGIGKRFLAGILGSWPSAAVGWIVYSAGPIPESDQTAAGAFLAALVCGAAGFVAGMIAGLRGRALQLIAITTTLGTAIAVAVAGAFGLPLQSVNGLDIGDIATLLIPAFLIGSAIWFAIENRGKSGPKLEQ